MLVRKNLEHSWQKSIGTIFILSLVGILFFQQFGSILGRWESLGAFERQFRADLVLYHAPPKDRFVNPFWRVLSPTLYDTLRTHPDIEEIYSYIPTKHFFLMKSYTYLRGRNLVIVVAPDEVPLIYPLNLSVDFLKNIATPGNAIVTQKFAKKYSLKLGGNFIYEQQSIRVAGIAGIKTDYDPLIVISSNTAALLNIDTNKKTMNFPGGAQYHFEIRHY